MARQFAITANAAELKDNFQVGAKQGSGVIEGDELRKFLRDKLVRTFVKKGVRAHFFSRPCRKTRLC